MSICLTLPNSGSVWQEAFNDLGEEASATVDLQDFYHLNIVSMVAQNQKELKKQEQQQREIEEKKQKDRENIFKIQKNKPDWNKQHHMELPIPVDRNEATECQSKPTPSISKDPKIASNLPRQQEAEKKKSHKHIKLSPKRNRSYSNSNSSLKKNSSSSSSSQTISKEREKARESKAAARTGETGGWANMSYAEQMRLQKLKVCISVYVVCVWGVYLNIIYLYVPTRYLYIPNKFFVLTLLG